MLKSSEDHGNFQIESYWKLDSKGSCRWASPASFRPSCKPCRDKYARVIWDVLAFTIRLTVKVNFHTFFWLAGTCTAWPALTGAIGSHGNHVTDLYNNASYPNLQALFYIIGAARINRCFSMVLPLHNVLSILFEGESSCVFYGLVLGWGFLFLCFSFLFWFLKRIWKICSYFEMWFSSIVRSFFTSELEFFHPFLAEERGRVGRHVESVGVQRTFIM